ncbi:MAG: hypothetical protein AB1815_10320 [Bacillota bacterium]
MSEHTCCLKTIIAEQDHLVDNIVDDLGRLMCPFKSAYWRICGRPAWSLTSGLRMDLSYNKVIIQGRD